MLGRNPSRGVFSMLMASALMMMPAPPSGVKTHSSRGVPPYSPEPPRKSDPYTPADSPPGPLSKARKKKLAAGKHLPRSQRKKK